jgi:hypothetical protein
VPLQFQSRKFGAVPTKSAEDVSERPRRLRNFELWKIHFKILQSLPYCIGFRRSSSFELEVFPYETILYLAKNQVCSSLKFVDVWREGRTTVFFSRADSGHTPNERPKKITWKIHEGGS